MKNIYSGFFLTGQKAQVMKSQLKKPELHVTWEFNPGKCQLPPQVKEGDIYIVRVVGIYKDSNIRAWIVQVLLPDGKKLTHQPTGTVLHVTTWNDDNTSPVESGRRATAKGWQKLPLNQQFEVEARAGFLKAN